MPQTPPSLPPPSWTPEPADLTQGNARAVVFRMAGVMAVVVAVALGLLGAHWYTSQSSSSDLDEALEEAGVSVQANGGGVSDDGASAGGAVLDVDAAVEGSTVFLNGDSVGVTPMQLTLDESGEQWVLVAQGGRTLLDTTLWVEYGEVTSLVADRRGEPAASPTTVETVTSEAQRGAIRVTSEPAGAAVLLDGRRVGETPVTIDGLSSGRYALAVRREGYEAVARTVAIRPGTRYEAALALQPVRAAEPAPPRPAPPQPRPAPAPAPPPPDAAPATGTVEVLVRPWGRIEIDGQVRQRESDVVYRTELPVGSHRIRVSHPVLGSQERDVIVNRGVTYRVDIDLDGDG